MHKHIVKPLIQQVKIDLGDQVAGLASARLCLDENSPSVKQQAETIGVTRARVYQLLEDCAKAMEVRWPEGRWLFAPLATRFGSSDPETIGLMHGISRPVLSGGTAGRIGLRRRPGRIGAVLDHLRPVYRAADWRSTTSVNPTSMYCPPVAWWQCTAIVFSPTSNALRDSASDKVGTQWRVKPGERPYELAIQVHFGILIMMRRKHELATRRQRFDLNAMPQPNIRCIPSASHHGPRCAFRTKPAGP